MFRFKMKFQVALFRHAYTLFTCDAHDRTLFSTKQYFSVHCSRNTPFSSNFRFFGLILSVMYFIASERFHTTHTALIITTSQRSILMCHKHFSGTFLITKLTIPKDHIHNITAHRLNVLSKLTA